MKPLSKPFAIAGVQFQNFPTDIFRGPSSVVQLIHNPANRFDPFAVEVHIDGIMIGHVPRSELAMLHHLARLEVPVALHVLKYDPNEPPYKQFLAQIFADEGYNLVVGKVTFAAGEEAS